VLYLKGLALAALGRDDEAVGSLSAAARKDRPSAEILCALAEAQLHAGNVAAAQTSVQEALALDPAHAASRSLSARIAMSAAPGNPVAR
jgi:Tfp pilus assembly protein PilF